ncbi:DEKNAAC101625 [Brettanomyces naardenensis]|uniref:Vacuolar transporter chaperone complex subunit 4 n=1 Tax=Brettanomyces naardenensis TaxID=13370 RepID=A0A448YIN9_BRENA|nr:DEKNAAC101625 [Brettanomyces naardenensis]
MKFGETLKSSLLKEFTYYYIQYDELKHFIKHGLDETNKKWSGQLEEEFVNRLEEELSKIFDFTTLKEEEINRRIADVEKLVNKTVENSRNANAEEMEYYEQDYEDLEDELRDIISSVYDLNTFTQLNYTGFQKILKKHDKQTKYILKPIYQSRLDAKPFYKTNTDEMIVKLSKLYDLVRTRGDPAKGDSAAGGTTQNFVRQTTKYWVHPDNITELKLIILQHLPVLVFNPNKDWEADDSAITSIYFDNENMDLYYGRLLKTEGAEAIRIRWYGNMDVDGMFIERKTHREDWTGEKSVKARFPIKESKINDFLKGKFTAKQAFEKMRKEGRKSTEEIDSLERLAQEAQYRIIKDGMRPVMRTFYHRTAFQLPGDARVRISLDTELTMVREDNFDGIDRTKGNWRRMDIGINYPFSNLPAADVERFPYAVLEVKLQTQLGQEPPQWVKDMVSSHLVEAVPKFSKFIHGCSTLLPQKVDLIPFWLPQMDVDIRKPKFDESYGIVHAQENGQAAGSAPGNNLDEEELVASNGSHNYGAVRIDESNNRIEQLPDQPETTWDKILDKVKDFYKYTFHSGNEEFENTVAPGTVYDTEVRAPPGKKIAVPVRVEPKVYFATERTYLSWLTISLIFAGTGQALMSYGDIVSFMTSTCFYLLSALTILYSTGMYVWRVTNVRKKRAARYDDQIGPDAVCGAMVIAVLVNFVFRYVY